MTCAHIEPTTCASDKDCKLQRVCDLGRCVWGGSQAGSQPGVVALGQKAIGPSPSLLALPPTETEPARTMFRFGPLHRGRTPYLIPAKKPSVEWAYATGGPISSSPALLDDGSIAFASHDQRLYVVGRDGTLKWSHATVGHHLQLAGGRSRRDALHRLRRRSSVRDRAVAEAAVDLSDRLLPAAGGRRPRGQPLRRGRRSHHRPGGVIYTGGDGIYAINPDGTLRWRFATGGHVSSAPAVLPDGTVIAGCQDDLVYAVGARRHQALGFSHRRRRRIQPRHRRGRNDLHRLGRPEAVRAGPDGTLRWAFTTGDDIRASAALSPGGLVLVGSFDAQLYAIKPDGTLAWTFRTGDRIVSSALVDAKGALLFGSQDDRVYALEADGRFRWSVELGGDVDSSPVLAADGTIYVGSDDKKLYALRAP